jgi:HlyD family secretion protein
MKKIVILILVMVAVACAAVAFYLLKKQPEATYRTAKVERGPLVSSVSSTGTLAAVITVQVGTQVSGTIQKLFVDFNSTVNKGEAIAEIDPALFTAQVEQTKGNYLSAQGNLEKLKADLVDARRNLERNRQLLKGGIISQGDFDSADNRCNQAAAAVKAAEGTVIQTKGAYDQALTNLRYATIRSPVDGIVVSRNVDVGQTVAASFQTPTLFTIAQDLTKMEIQTSVDESDISRVKVGQPVSFTVDAYPETRFIGRVRQIRNAPVVTQNVVTYVVVVNVDNKELKLKPGMTANVSIETARKDNVLKIPSAALRFKPKKPSDGKGKSAGMPQTGGKRMAKKADEQVYILTPEKSPKPVPVKTGISNDGSVELVEGNLKENDEVIVEQSMSSQKKSSGMGGAPMGPRF